MPDETLVYLDTSAFVKLAIPEPETVALITALTPKTVLVASEIPAVEALRATRPDATQPHLRSRTPYFSSPPR